jgi:condensin complex subunit 3
LASIVRIPATLDAILARTRDTDATVRKLVYSTVLDPKSQQGDAIAVIHPRALTIAQRETVVRNGLGDREESVRLAAQKLIGLWAQLVRDQEDDQAKAEDGDPTVHDNLILFLKMFDLSECKIAEDALLSVLTTQQAIFEKLLFGGLCRVVLCCSLHSMTLQMCFGKRSTPKK